MSWIKRTFFFSIRSMKAGVDHAIFYIVLSKLKVMGGDGGGIGPNTYLEF